MIDDPYATKPPVGLGGLEDRNEGITGRQIPLFSIDREQAALDRGEAFETVRPPFLKMALECGRVVHIGHHLKPLTREKLLSDLDRILPRHDMEVLHGVLGAFALALHALEFAQLVSMHGYMPAQRLRDDIAALVGVPWHEVATDGVLGALCKRRHAVWLDGPWLRVGSISFSTEELRFPKKIPPILVGS